MLQSLCGDATQSVNDRLCRLLFFLASLKDAGAASVTGTTLARAVESCRRAGATAVHIAATHAVFTDAAHQLFEPGVADSVVVTDSVTLNPTFDPYRANQLTVLPSAPLFAEAIRRMEAGGSLSELRDS